MITGMSGPVLLTTGGTIATSVGPDGIARHASAGRELLDSIGRPDVPVIDVMALDSSTMSPSRWQQLRRCVREQIEAGASAVVISHGTDTLEETALWLALTCRAPVPVVLTGAQRSASHTDPDGPGNLRDAFLVACSAEATDLGVLVSFARQVFSPVGVRKVDLLALDGFDGPTRIGRILSGSFVRSGTAPSAFLGEAEDPLPRVDVVNLYPGVDAVALDAYVAAGAQGLILETMGSGNANDAVIDAVVRHTRTGITVLATTRVPHGHLRLGYEPGQRLLEAGAVAVPTLRAGQARVLLMAALATRSDVGSVIDRLG